MFIFVRQKQINMTTSTIEIGKTYTFINALNYTSTAIVTRITENSVFYVKEVGGAEFRQSVKQFTKTFL